MKWFRHFSSLHRQAESQAVLKYLGPEWYGRYIILLELCAEQYDGEHSSTTITLQVDHLKTTLRVVGDKWQTTLRLLGEYNGFTFEVVGEFIKIEIPIVAELFHKDATSSKARRATLGPVAGRDKTKTKTKIRLEESLQSATEVATSPPAEVINFPKPKKESNPNLELNRDIWDAYEFAYEKRWKQKPVRNAKVNRNISDLGKRLGFDAVSVVDFFVNHNKSYYVERTHDISLCLKDAETLHTQWKRGQAITKNEIKTFETEDFYKQQMERLGKT
jgi:hypothetical protein